MTISLEPFAAPHPCDCGACKRRRGLHGRRHGGKCSCGFVHCDDPPKTLRDALDEAVRALEDIAANHEDFPDDNRHLLTARLALGRIKAGGMS